MTAASRLPPGLLRAAAISEGLKPPARIATILIAFSRMTELGGRYQLAVLSTSVDDFGEATGAVSASAAGGRDSGDSGTFVAVGEEILGFAA
jgi:hypothetical protein